MKATWEALEGQEAVVAVAVREYEAWFLAGIESLRDRRAVKDDAAYPKGPEAKRGAKEALQEQMIENYAEMRHQVAFSSILDDEQRSSSERSNCSRLPSDSQRRRLT